MMHDYHDALPGYDERQILHDGCREHMAGVEWTAPTTPASRRDLDRKAIAVKCPQCGAGPAINCRAVGSGTVKKFPHNARRRAAS